MNRDILSMTFDELRSYDFGSWFNDKFKGTKLPSVEEFLTLCETADIEIMNIEIKLCDFRKESKKLFRNIGERFDILFHVGYERLKYRKKE